MRNTTKILLAAVLVFSMLGMAQADDPLQAEKTIAVSLTVPNNFGMQIWDTEYSQVLGEVPMGAAGMGDIHMYVTTNRGMPWQIQAASTGAISTSNPDHNIPVKFTTFGDDRTGTFYTDVVLGTGASTVYTSGVGETTGTGMVLNGLYVIPIVEGVVAGDYNANIVLTMTE